MSKSRIFEQRKPQRRPGLKNQTRSRRTGQNRDAELDQRKIFTRRALVFGGIQLGAASALIGRMYQLQVIQAQDFAVQAEDNRINTRLLIPPRGRLLDRNGQVMAGNREDYRVYVIAERTPNLQATLDRLALLLAMPDEDKARLMREIRKRRRWVPFPVAVDLTWEQLARIEGNTPELPGVFVEQGLTRFYPAASSAAHVVGYVAPPTEDDQALDGDPLLSLPEFRVGKGGVERMLDKALRGQSGYAQVEINAAGKVQRELARREGTPGTDVTLSIDLDIQRYAMGLLAQHESGAAVVLDVHTGEVVALASHPGFDPNAFVGGIGSELWRSLNANPTAPLNNKCVAGQYSPGSTFKMMTALAGLESGAINERTVFTCGGALQLGGHTLHCWRRGGHGGLTVRDAIKQSCDVFFYQCAMHAGIDHFAETARRFGIGAVTGIDLPHEKPGLMPDAAWKRHNFKNDTKFHAGELAIAGIGQGYVLATPLQLAVMTARLCNGGRAITPRLIKSPDKIVAAGIKPAIVPSSIGVRQGHLDLMTSAMSGVVNEPGGTAQRVRIDEPGLHLGGKTGTAQVRRITTAERAKGVIRNEDLPWDRRDHALFVCFGPVSAPRFACAVVVEHGGSGGVVAGPIARELMLETMHKYIPVSERKLPETIKRSRAERGRD
ncbi:MAG: penicillin-binding protein 2 [Rhodospirillaceae bacterium]|nr:penicillin-binding protein 2 [Rhodospirillaceae bacterium]